MMWLHNNFSWTNDLVVKKWCGGRKVKSSSCSEGWSDFEKNATLSMLFQIDVGPPIPKCCVLMLPFHFVAGPQKISNCYSTLKWANKIVFNIFKGFKLNKMCPITCEN